MKAIHFDAPGNPEVMKVVDVVCIGLVAAATFSLLDLAAPSVSSSARTGAGLGVGANLVGFPHMS